MSNQFNNDNNNGKKVTEILSFKTGKPKEPMSRDEARSQEKTRITRRRKISRIIKSAVVGLLFAALATFLLLFVFFKADTITVTGNNLYPAQTVIEKSGLEEGCNLFAVSEVKTAQRLKKELPYISDVTLERKAPSTIIINVTESAEVAAVPFQGAYVLLDSTGKILKTDAILTKDTIPVVSGIELVNPETGSTAVFKVETVTEIKTVPDGEKSEDGKEETTVITNEIDRGKILLTILAVSDKADIRGMTDIDLRDTENITMKYNGRITVLLGNANGIEKKLKMAGEALKKLDENSKNSVGVLDASSEPYTYFKPGSTAVKNAAKKNTAKAKKK